MAILSCLFPQTHKRCPSVLPEEKPKRMPQHSSRNHSSRSYQQDIRRSPELDHISIYSDIEHRREESVSPIPSPDLQRRAEILINTDQEFIENLTREMMKAKAAIDHETYQEIQCRGGWRHRVTSMFIVWFRVKNRRSRFQPWGSFATSEERKVVDRYRYLHARFIPLFKIIS